MTLGLALWLAAAQRYSLPGQPLRQGASASPAQLVASPAQEYLIPGDPSVVGQWNASDLANGTARVGPAWTKVGSPTFNAAQGATPPRVSNLTDSNYFSQALGSANPMSPAQPFCVIIVAIPTVVSTNSYPTLVGAGNYTSTGYELTLISPTTPYTLQYVGDAAFNQIITSNGGALGVPHVYMAGSAGNTSYAQLDNGPLASASATYVQDTTIATYLGRNTPTGYWFTGSIIEVQSRKVAPSAALFTAIYQAVEANL